MGISDDFNAENAALGPALLQELSTPRDGRTANAGLIDRVTELLDNGAPLEARDSAGMTPLILAARHGRIALINLLIQRGASLTAQDSSSMTALDHALQQKNRPATEALKKAGAVPTPVYTLPADMAVQAPARIFKNPVKIKITPKGRPV